MSGPLQGLRVVEVASFVAGPFACLSLAQLGADVIRIDPIGGAADQHRWPLSPSGRSIYWAGLNKHKRTVELDLRSDRGRDLAAAIATAPGEDAGVVVTNVPRGDWIGYDALVQRRPDLIHVKLTGLPDGGPSVDYTVNAGLGFPLVTGADGPPVNHVLPAWDLLAGSTLALSVLAAERTRRATGQGDALEVSLWDVALAATSHLGYLGEAGTLPEPRSRNGNYYYGGFGHDFVTVDGRVMVVVLSKHQWRALIEATDSQAEVSACAERTGADFTTDSDRFTHREAIAALLAPWFDERTTAEVVSVLGKAGVLCERYRTFQEMARVKGPLVGANPMLESIDEPGIGRLLASGSPIRSRRHAPLPVKSSHGLGADTEQVLAEVLGLGAAEIGRLADAGVIGLASQAVGA